MKKIANNFRYVVLAAIVIITTVGCAATAHIEKDESVNFSKYKSFSWVDENEKSLKDRNSNSLIDKHIKSAVSAQLQKNGWVEDNTAPGIVMDYNIMVENNIKENSSPVYSRPFTRYFYNPVTRRISGLYYPSQMLGFERNEIPYKEGTITLHMIDNSTNKLIWQGWTTNEVNSRNLTAKEINSGVRSILKKFDPSQG